MGTAAKYDLFVPGRLCIFGEHSDWAGYNRIMNAEILPGMAILTGIEEGIYATVQEAPAFIVHDQVAKRESEWTSFECPMDVWQLNRMAHEGGFYCYAAGVASYMCEWYRVGGIEINITRRTIPMKSGLSSSAAICVLIARAFNLVYGLNLNVLGEMNIAFMGEQRTPSRCGRLDQACAFGLRPVMMGFDGNEISIQRLVIGKELNLVISNVHGTKDTLKILTDLSRCFPFPSSNLDSMVHAALGEDNHRIVTQAAECMKSGNLKMLGILMTEAQQIFDEKVAPASPEQLSAPALHSLLSDPTVMRLSYGAKGVGSQGDGSAQFLARDKHCQLELVEYLKGLGLCARTLSIPKSSSVHRAIIPVAGFGTRMYPATRVLPKSLLPVIDVDGLVKPAILVILEQLLDCGIDEVCIVIGDDWERTAYQRLFDTRLPDENYAKLPKSSREYETKLKRLGKMLRYVAQEQQLGFGHAVYQCRHFANDEPVLLLLGDTLTRSCQPQSCTAQLVDAFETVGGAVVSICPVSIKDVTKYGIMTGSWEDNQQRILKVSKFVEKPSPEYAADYLCTSNRKGEYVYYGVFGHYVITREVFIQLEEDIVAGVMSNGEIQLTHALDVIREKHGLSGCVINGTMYDIGNATAYRNTVKMF